MGDQLARLDSFVAIIETVDVTGSFSLEDLLDSMSAAEIGPDSDLNQEPSSEASK
jgi:hypothetical protein